MMNSVTVQVITYNRPDAIRQTLTSLFAYLHYEGDFKLHVNDDHTGGDYLDKLETWLSRYCPWPFRFQQLGRNSGLGANNNAGLQVIDTDMIFTLQDDYELKEHIDITPGVALLNTDENIGLIRYSGILGHNLTATMHERDIPAPHYKQGHMFVPHGRANYWVISEHSNNLYIYSDRPHLKHKRFHEFYGEYPIGLTPGQTEEVFAHRVRDYMRRSGAPKIAVFPEHVSDPFGIVPVVESYNQKEV